MPTLKQFAKLHFLDVLQQYRQLKAGGLTTDEEKHAFILLSVRLHAAKSGVPKRWWPLANK